jgi:hypothetical protein
MLFCVSEPTGDHWTLLGDPEYVRGLRVASQPTPAAERIPSPPGEALGIKPVQRGVLMDLVEAEFPIDAFRPQWAVAGWPDEWMIMDGVDIWPWRMISDQ